jgi:hypothetical protein
VNYSIVRNAQWKLVRASRSVRGLDVGCSTTERYLVDVLEIDMYSTWSQWARTTYTNLKFKTSEWTDTYETSWLVLLMYNIKFSVTFNIGISQGSVQQGCTIFYNSRSHLIMLGAGRVMWSKFNTGDPQILGSKVQNWVTLVTWHPWFVHPCSKMVRISCYDVRIMIEW